MTRHGGVRDVVEEGVAGANATPLAGLIGVDRVEPMIAFTIVGGWIAERRRSAAELPTTSWGVAAFGPGMNLPYGSDAQQRNIADVEIGQLDAEDVLGLRLDVGPGGKTAARPQADGRWRSACRPDQ